MSHHKYHTQALLVGVSPRGEKDVSIHLLTEDLGLIVAVSKAARSLRSKHRMSLTEGNLVKASVVRGQEFWRLTNVSFIKSFYSDLQSNKDALRIMWSINTLIRRIVPQDVVPMSLFDIVAGLWQVLPSLNKEEAYSAECIALLNIVHDLGYLGEDPKWQKFIGKYEYESELLHEMGSIRKEAIVVINNSIQMSHL